jgi:hypothetical protein
MGRIYETAIEMASEGIMSLPSFMKISSGIQVMLMLRRISSWDMTPCSPLSFTRHFRGTSGATQWNTRRHIPEDDTLHNHRCENLKSYNVKVVAEKI